MSLSKKWDHIGELIDEIRAFGSWANHAHIAAQAIIRSTIRLRAFSASIACEAGKALVDTSLAWSRRRCSSSTPGFALFLYAALWRRTTQSRRKPPPKRASEEGSPTAAWVSVKVSTWSFATA